ncbi:MAG: hypothetical protein JSR54_11945 [Proteobacteria bacterium]|nr:hypothetical protein [Pseudomonadota bacterium]
MVQAVGIGVLGATVLNRGPAVRPAGGFETLSAPAGTTPAPSLRVVFAATMTVGELKTLLTSEHLVIVAGPSDAGVFSLGPSQPTGAAPSLDASLATLRANPHVLFAEPIAASGAQRP